MDTEQRVFASPGPKVVEGRENRRRHAAGPRGRFSYDDRRQVTAGNTVLSTSTTTREGDVAAGNHYSNSNSDQKFYSRGLDAGLQAGLGYRNKGFKLQAGYSWGLRNLGADYKVSGDGQTQTSPGPA